MLDRDISHVLLI